MGSSCDQSPLPLNTFQKSQNLAPTQFFWPKQDLVQAQEELNAPIIDLAGFFTGDASATAATMKLLREACLDHGFFQVINHGVDEDVIHSACDEIDALFSLPVEEKLRLRRKEGSVWGYSGAHADRFSTNLPWKETYSFRFDHGCGLGVKNVVDYFDSVLGRDFQKTGLVYQKYCEQMENLSLLIFEVLEVSLGVEKGKYRKMFEEGTSIMRCNYYPRCEMPELTLGTGPHADPTSITILHQDDVGGLEVFTHNKWQSVRPRPNALVINIGDTFMALTNGKYKSCLHRAMTNKEKDRKSMVYFVCPKEELVLKPPEEIMDGEQIRKYPDFTWADFYDFTQKHRRVDASTLDNYFIWKKQQQQPHF